MDFSLRSTHQFTKRMITIEENTSPYRVAARPRSGPTKAVRKSRSAGAVATSVDATTRSTLERRSQAEVLARRVCEYYATHYTKSNGINSDAAEEEAEEKRLRAQKQKQKQSGAEMYSKYLQMTNTCSSRDCFACSLNREEFLRRTTADPFDQNAGEGDAGNTGLPLSLEVISELMTQHVRELSGQLHDEHSCRHYERHVRLTQELLQLFRVEKAAAGGGGGGGGGGEVQLLGFTPSMVVGGLGDIIESFKGFLLKGKLLKRSGGNKYIINRKADANSGDADPYTAPAVYEGADPAAADAAAAAAAGGNNHTIHNINNNATTHSRKSMRNFSPSSTVTGQAAADGGATVAKLSDIPIDAYLPPLLAHPGTDTSLGAEPLPASGTEAAENADGGGMLQRVRDNLLVTVADALLALLTHCAEPLTLLTPDDHRCLPRAVERLADILTGVIADVHSLDLCVLLPGHAHGASLTESVRKQRLKQLGGLLVPQHQAMTAAMRAAAILALEKTLCTFDRRFHAREAKLREMRSKAKAPRRAGKAEAARATTPYDLSGLPDTLVESTCGQLSLHQYELSGKLVQRWRHLLEHAIVLHDMQQRDEERGRREENFKTTPPVANNEEMLHNPLIAVAKEGGDAPAAQPLMLDSKKSLNPVTAAHVQQYEREKHRKRVKPEDSDSTDSEDNNNNDNNNVVGNGAARTSASTAAATTTINAAAAKTGAGDLTDAEEEEIEEQAQHRLRGVMSAKEEREVTGMLSIFQHFLSIAAHNRTTDADQQEAEEEALRRKSKTTASSTARDNYSSFAKSKEEKSDDNIRAILHPQVAVLTVATLARCTPGDACNSSCVDFLWSLMRLAPEATTEAILYDSREMTGDTTGVFPNGCSGEAEPAVKRPTAMENLFQALVNQLNASHRQYQRELRNDLCIFVAFLLRTNTRYMLTLPVPEGGPLCGNGDSGSAGDTFASAAELWDALAPLSSAGVAAEPRPVDRLGPLPDSTVDAANAIAVVLFDLVCGTELVQVEEHGQGVSGFYNIPLLSQNTLQRYQLRHHGVASPTLRRDNLQFKRLGWQALELFCEWQAIHVYHGSKLWRAAGGGGGDAEASAAAPLPYDGLFLVDVCRLGFIDVLLLYLDLKCDRPAVVSWTAEELLTLQAEAWALLTALVESAQYNRERFGEEEGVLLTAAAIRRLREKRKDSARPADGSVEEVEVVLEASSVSASADGGEIVIDLDDTQTHAEQQKTALRSVEGEDFGLAQPLSSGAPANEEEGRVSEKPAEKEEEEKEVKGNDDKCADDDDERFQGADLHFLEAGGVECALYYVYDAPSTVEPLKEMALLLLSTVARCSHASDAYSSNSHVRTLLVRTPGLTPLLVSLLEGVYEHTASNTADTLDNAKSQGTLSGATREHMASAMADFNHALDGEPGVRGGAGEEFLAYARQYPTDESSDGRRETAAPTEESSLRAPGAFGGGAGRSLSGSSPFGRPTGSFFPQHGLLIVALECLDFLANLGDAVLGETGGIREWAPSPAADDGEGTEELNAFDEEEEDEPDFAEVSSPVEEKLKERAARQKRHRRTHRRTLLLASTRQDILQLPFIFAEVGGVRVLVQWMWRSVATQTSGEAVTLARYQALSAPATAVRAPPLSEALLIRHIDLIFSVLDVTRSLVLGSAANEAAFVDADGVFVLLLVIEALAAAGDALLPANWSAAASSSTYRFGRDPAVIVRDHDPVITTGQWRNRGKHEAFHDHGIFESEAQALYAEHHILSAEGEVRARKLIYRDGLCYALSLLSDLLSNCPSACVAFAQWHSRRLEKTQSQSASAAMPHPSAHLAFLSAPQMLISMWASAVQEIQQFHGPPPRERMATTATPEDAAASSANKTWSTGTITPAPPASANSGLQVLGIYMRDQLRRLLKREFVRRLLRLKVSRTGEAPSEEELLRYYHYMKSEDPQEEEAEREGPPEGGGVSAAKRESVVRSMMTLVNLDDTTDEELRRRLTTATLSKGFGLGTKVYSCFASFGFDRFRSAGSATTLQGFLDGEAAPHSPITQQLQQRVPVVPLSPAERAHLIMIAALPSLMTDELCCAMAETAQVFSDVEPRRSRAVSEASQAPSASTGVAMRPTSPDRRSLRRLLGEMKGRSSEMEQLAALCERADAEQQQQLFDRFLVSRIRHPEGVTSVSGQWKTPHLQYPRPTDSATARHIGGPPPPATLARELQERLAESHKAQGTLFMQSSTERAFRPTLRADGTISECTAGGSSLEAAEYHNFAHSYPVRSARPAPPLTETAAQTMMHASRTRLMRTGSAGATQASGKSSAFNLTLQQRRQKKKDMIAGSLRKLPHHHLSQSPPKSEERAEDNK